MNHIKYVTFETVAFEGYIDKLLFKYMYICYNSENLFFPVIIY